MSFRSLPGRIQIVFFGLLIGLLGVSPTRADPVLYEAGLDPGVGFNLISWSGFTGSTQWINAINALDSAGFTEVSISPLRFVELDLPNSGSLFSSGTPSLTGVAAGISHAKSLGMRVTVNPFVEPEGFAFWRGQYNPTGAEATRFWNDYTTYLSDVATIAEANGADSLIVGTELKAITQNSANNSSWGSAISAVDSIFTGTLGYAANWDNYQNANLRNTIWENPAIDFIGIDSYFQSMLSTSQADNSGAYPNIDFITAVENAWTNKLDNEILPYAAARKGGAGMPVEFTEIGYLPHNRTTVTPQGNSQPLDQDEQNMAFEGFMRALDGRLASGEFLAAHIWQWNMSGSGGSLWNMDPSGGDQPNNQQTAQWLSSFVQGTNLDPGDPPDPPPPGATQILYSFETGLEGFAYPNFETEPPSTLAQVSGIGETDGDHSLAITKPTQAWTWDARVFMSGDQLQAMQNAIADNIDDYVLEMDVTYVADDLPANLTDLNMHISFQSQPGGEWGQAFPFAAIGSPVDQLFQVEVPLSAIASDNPDTLVPGISSLAFHLGFAGSFTGNATIYIDRIALTDLTFVAPENANFDGDDDVDGNDFLIWQRGFGMTEGASLEDGDANGDGAVNESDLEIWEGQYGTSGLLTTAATAVPEPATCLSLLLAAGLCPNVRRRR